MRVIRIFSEPVNPNAETLIAQFGIRDIDLAAAYFSSHKFDPEFLCVWFENVRIR
jgi:hypothetical protein